MSWYNDPNPNNVLVHGISYVPEYQLNTPQTNVYKYTDMNDDFAKRTSGLDVLYNHQDKTKIGEVVKSFVDYKRHLHSFLLLNQNEEAVSRIMPGIYNKKLPGLSMGTDVKVNLNTKGYAFAEKITPKEISVVADPDIKGCNILGTYVLPKHKTREYLENIINKTENKYK